MRWLRLVGSAALGVPIYAVAWLMSSLLLTGRGAWGDLATGCVFGLVMGGFDVVRRARSGPASPRRRMAEHVRRGRLPTDDAERDRLSQYVRRQRRGWHPFWLTASVFVGIAVVVGLGAALAGGRPRLVGALLLLVLLAIGLVVERVNLHKLARMERLLDVESTPPTRPLQAAGPLTAGPSDA